MQKAWWPPWWCCHGVTHDTEVDGANPAGKSNINIKTSIYFCKQRGWPSGGCTKWGCNTWGHVWTALQCVMAMSAHGATWIWLLVLLMVLRAQHLPGVPEASLPGMCGKGCCGKCCRSSLVNTPEKQNSKGSVGLCSFPLAFNRAFSLYFSTIICNSLIVLSPAHSNKCVYRIWNHSSLCIFFLILLHFFFLL